MSADALLPVRELGDWDDDARARLERVVLIGGSWGYRVEELLYTWVRPGVTVKHKMYGTYYDSGVRDVTGNRCFVWHDREEKGYD